MNKLVFALPLLAACVTPPAAVYQTSNQQVTVELLFEHDGCRIYRFRDPGYHYYARCEGAPQPQVQTMSTVSCGKNCRRDENIATLP